MDRAGNGVAKLYFIVADRVAADDRTLRFDHFRETATQNLFEYFRRARGRIREDGQRGNWNAAHRVHVAERICCSYLAEERGIVNNWGEEIHGLDDGQVVGEL